VLVETLKEDKREARRMEGTERRRGGRICREGEEPEEDEK
jgi:hypothetical protein